jgi:SPW repeat
MKPVPIIRVDRRVLAGGAVILWVALSPWLWGFADSRPAVANHVSLVSAFGPLALMIVNLRPAAFVTLLGGIWLVVSPWLLGYATDHTAWLNELVSGVLLIVLCADAAGARGFMRARRKHTTGRTAASTRAVAETAGSRS